MRFMNMLLFASLVAGAVAAGDAAAETLYKLVAPDGKVTYVQEPPKNFDGKVIRLDIDPNANTAQSPKPPAKVEDGKPAGVLPTLEERRAKRAILEANVRKAQEKLDAARLALAKATSNEPSSDDQQVVAQEGRQLPPGTPLGPLPPSSSGGMSQSRMNCRAVVRNGKTVEVCGGAMASPERAQRVADLENAVKAAEAELEEAQRAYRRGVD